MTTVSSIIVALLTSLALGQEPVRPPEVLEHVSAPWPQAALDAGVDGVVRLLVQLDEDGAVVSVEVMEGVGYGLNEAAMEAVRRTRFSPAVGPEGPVAVRFEFSYGFTLTPTEKASAPINLSGQVLERGTGRPVQGAEVTLSDGSQQALTDAEGAFSLRGVPPGHWALSVYGPSHLPARAEVEVLDGRRTEATVWLKVDALSSHDIVVIGHREQQEVTQRTLSMEEIQSIPGTFGDPIKVVQTLPGAARTPFGTGMLVIRGADPDDSAVYIDGIRIPIIYHLTGTTSVISPDLIASVDYLPGGYGVQRGRSLGGVVEAHTRTDLSDERLAWGTDILDSQVYYQGTTKGGHGIAIAARRSYIDLFIPYFMRSSFTLRPWYWDYQAKGVAKLDGGRELSAFVYGFRDVLTVSTPEGQAQGPDQDTQGDLRTGYLSHRLIVRYRQPLGERLALELVPSLGMDATDFSMGGDFGLSSTTWIAQLRAELPWEASEHLTVVPGVDAISGLWRFDFRSALSYADADDPFADREPISFDGHGAVVGPDLFLRAELRPLAQRERLLIVPGVRGDLIRYTYGGTVTGEEGGAPWARASWDPRLHARYQVVSALAVKGSTGLYHQLPQPAESVGTGNDVTLDYEQAWATSAGVELRLSQALSMEAELFHKRMSELVVFNEAWTGFGEHPFINAGEGRAQGVELIVRHEPVGRLFGWISYTLSEARRRDHADGDWYRFDFDQPHIFSAQGGYQLPWDLSVSAQVQYVSGNPDTPYNAGIYDADGGYYAPFRVGAYNTSRLPPYFQTSLRAERRWTLRTWRLDTYVDLLNAVRGVNPEFTLYDYDYSHTAYVRGLPFIPNVGFEAEFSL
ncbi:MAG: TonB family protein [Deltaproteobacteria bacterium]|nr:TonB family protein [Deltaproteobacteria bacterium]